MDKEKEKEIPIRVDNEWALHSGQNLPNHSMTLIGRGRFIRAGVDIPLIFRTRQQVFRFAAYILAMAEALPDEDGEHTLEEVMEAVQNPKRKIVD